MADLPQSYNSTAAVATNTPVQYMKRLREELAQEYQTSCDDVQGRINFPEGACNLFAGQTGVLTLTAIAPDIEALSDIQDIVGGKLTGYDPNEGNLSVRWGEVVTTS